MIIKLKAFPLYIHVFEVSKWYESLWKTYIFEKAKDIVYCLTFCGIMFDMIQI